MIEVGDANRNRLATGVHPGFGLFQPGIVRLGWGLRFYRPTALFYFFPHQVRTNIGGIFTHWRFAEVPPPKDGQG